MGKTERGYGMGWDEEEKKKKKKEAFPPSLPFSLSFSRVEQIVRKTLRAAQARTWKRGYWKDKVSNAPFF